MRPRGGFTLLEVLGAVLVIGVAFTLLAAANIEGLRAEGLARRQLAASLVADRAIAEIEAGLAGGAAPQVGRRETEVDGYRVVVEVAPLELALEALPEGVPAGFGDAGGGPSLLAAPGRGGATPLRSVRIAVSWDDGSGERSVARETFVFDAASVESLLAPLSEEPTP